MFSDVAALGTIDGHDAFEHHIRASDRLLAVPTILGDHRMMTVDRVALSQPKKKVHVLPHP
jgi:hypothetical protein